jgi:enoyl-CoA hydratase/carnithine racemase
MAPTAGFAPKERNMSGAVVVTDDGAVRTIRLNRPEKKNALTLAMYADMTKALREANQTDAIRCVMFAGSPGAFCAGNDISDFLGAALGGGLEPRAIDFMKELGKNQKPIVAAVGGVAIGIGTTMLFHCDHVVDAYGSCAGFLASGNGPAALRRRSQRRRHRQQRGRRR